MQSPRSEMRAGNATNAVSDDASLREAVPESQEQTAAVSEGEDASHSEAATAVTAEAKQENVDASEPQAEMPAVAAVTEPSQETRITREPFRGDFATVYFLGCPAWAVADVQQRRVSRRCRGFGIVIHPVSAATANAGPGHYSRIHRIAPDALSEHRER